MAPLLPSNPLLALRNAAQSLTVAAVLGLAAPALAAGQITVGVGDNILGLDPTDLNDSVSLSASRLFFQGLYGFDRDLKLVPVLAEKTDVNADSTQYTVHLRRDVKFHDGTPFNAEAVKINYDRLRDPANHLKRQSLLEAIDKVEVIDDFTIRLVLKAPSGVLLNYLAHTGASILSPKAIAQYGKEVSRHPVGTGPFVFTSWATDNLKAARNPDYWRKGLPRADGVTIRSVGESGARLALLRSGEAQFIFPLPQETVQVVEKDSRLAIDKTPSIVTQYVALNTQKKPFDDVRVRQALNYAIDKTAFIKVVYNGFGIPQDAPVAPGIAFYSKQGVWPYDPAKAKQLLAEAGYPDGFETEIWNFSNTLNNRASQFLQQQLAAVGVKVKLNPLEAGVATTRLWGAKTPEEAEVRMFFGSWAPSTGDADWALRPLLSSRSFPPALYNIAYFKDAEVDAELQKGLGTADAGQRKAAYDKIQKLVWEKAPWIFLSVNTLVAGRDKRLTGLTQLPDTSLTYEDAELQ